jgi:glucokinase
MPEPIPSTKPGKLALAVDIGGTKVATALVDLNGQVIGEIQTNPVPFLPDGRADGQALTALILAEVKRYDRQMVGVGLSLCGNVDEDTGLVPLSPNLHWRYYPFGSMVSDAVNLPVSAATDVRMAALAESIWGAARGVRFFAWATIGTGYGGYLFLDGKLYRGFHGYAGNFGHNTWDELTGEMCGCGKKGCVETFVSGPGIARAGQRAVDAGAGDNIRQLAGNGPLQSRHIFQAAAQGDPAARQVIEEVIRLTAINLASLVNILDLQMIVVGGGIAHADPNYVDWLAVRVRDFLMTDEAKRDLQIVKETFLNAALIGAAADVFQRQGLIQNQILGAVR